jgi:putative nucleotidyltransferase with HDIG domain
VFNNLTHIRVGRIQTEEKKETSAADIATIRRLYSDATNIAGSVWESAQTEGVPDPKAARALVDSLAQAVSANRTALIALTALKNYDNYTFTHMVNVSILTMSQARALGIDGSTLRELGLAALMHDIGKVRTPTEILNKPEKLTDSEFQVMRMHVVDGAEILRRTPEMPAIAPVIAFEHHLRLDGTGYPFGVSRSGLNVGTMLLQHRRRLRRDAIAARVSAGVSIRSHPGSDEAQSTGSSSINTSFAASRSCSASTRPATWCVSTMAPPRW